MTSTQKKYNVETVLVGLFEKYEVPPSAREFQAIQDEIDTLSHKGIMPQTEIGIRTHFEPRVAKLAERLQSPKAELELQQKSEAIASERSLAPVRLNNSRMLMAYPWFSPDQKLRKGYFEYTSPNGAVTLGVHPSPKYGAAKVWDGDILMYALSKATKAYLATGRFPSYVTFTAYEYLKQAGKTVSGRARKDLRDQLERLATTSYECSFIDPVTKKGKGKDFFTLCSVSYLEDEDEEVGGIIITFSEELFRYFASKNDLLTLNNDLLLEAWKEDRSGLRKRLLMVVGVHIGNQPSWQVGLRTLQGMCGHNTLLKRFKEAFTALIPNLPWKVEFGLDKAGEPKVTFYRNEEDNDPKKAEQA